MKKAILTVSTLEKLKEKMMGRLTVMMMAANLEMKTAQQMVN